MDVAPLQGVYAAIFVDAIYVKVRSLAPCSWPERNAWTAC